MTFEEFKRQVKQIPGKWKFQHKDEKVFLAVKHFYFSGQKKCVTRLKSKGLRLVTLRIGERHSFGQLAARWTHSNPQLDGLTMLPTKSVQ